jgi:lipoprotein-releasing system permease protein
MAMGTIAVYLVVMLAIAIFLNLGGWYLTIRLFDRVGRHLKFYQFVAVRHLRGRKSGFLTAIGILSILGVSFSSCTLTTVLSVMGGFSNDLKQKILATNAHVVVDNYGADLAGDRDAEQSDLVPWRQVLAQVREVPGVRAATPLVQGEVMMNARTNNHGIQLKGVAIDSFRDVSRVLDELDKGKVRHLDRPEELFKEVRQRRARLYGRDPDADDAKSDAGAKKASAEEESFIPAPVNPRRRVLPAVIVGRELSKALRLYIGEEVNIISPLGDIGPTGPIPKSRPFRVGGVFFSGMYEFDSLYAYTSLEAAQEFLRKGDRVSEIHVAVADPDRAEEVAAQISTAVGQELRVRPWQELNASLFSALKLEKIVMFIFLSFAILVASFCIVATLTMLVLEKGAEISVLMTLGATGAAVQRVFRFEGLLIGLVGTISGLLVGFGLSMSLKYVGLPIDPEVWYIDKLPVDVSALEFLFVGLASLAITQLATLYPTRVAASLSPVEGLKYE